MTRQRLITAGLYCCILSTSALAGPARMPQRLAGQEETMRPHVFVTAEKVGGLRSVAEVREAIKDGHATEIWDEMKAQADADLTAQPLLPTSVVPGRPASQAKLANPDWSICHLVGQRILRAALAQLITGDPTRVALELNCLFSS